ncbi:MAG TPA: hypothetical protein VGP93_01695 [Polyangiaceae bacterium]|jgi:chromosome segregation ATPase|nr:hypothetical protein [Polyangiaceae bacterium]
MSEFGQENPNMKLKTSEQGNHGSAAELDLGLADTWPGVRVSASKRRSRQISDLVPRRETHDQDSDPEKVRLVAEINTVWRQLEEEEDKHQRLGEEIDELHLSLSEEQLARSAAAREKRAAEQREAAAERDLRKLKSERDAMAAQIKELQNQLNARRSLSG